MGNKSAIPSIMEDIVQSQFVNRLKELSLFEDMLKADRTIGILSISGDGGTGKTWFMLRALQQALAKGRMLCAKPIDFYITEYHSAAGVREDLSQQLGSEHFSDYQRAMNDLRLGRAAGQSPETIMGLDEKVQSAFINGYNNLADRWDKILLSFDTFEVVQDQSVGQWLINELLPKLHRTVVLLSGRKNKSIDFGSLVDIVVPVELGEVQPEDAHTYFRLKGVTDVPEDVVKKLWEKAEGRPLLLDLVIDWLKENLDFEGLVETPPEKFEEELVARIRELRDSRYRAILYMAWAHRRLDLEMLKWLMQDETVNYSLLVEDLRKLSFVKYRGQIQSILLHDKMRDLVVKYVWGIVDPMATERIALSQRIIAYYDQFLIPQAFDEKELQNLEAEKLFFTLYLDLGKGYEHFAEVFDKLFDDQRYDDCEVLLVEIDFYRDRLPLEQIGEVDLRRAELFIQRNRLEEAESKILKTLDKYPDSNLKVSMLLTLGNVFSRRNRIKTAIAYCEEAKKIGQHAQLDSNTIGRIDDRLGYFYRLLGRWDDAIGRYSEALENATDLSVISNILNTIGYIHALRTDYDTALEYCQESLKIRKDLGLKKPQGLSWSTLGEVYRYKGRYKDALDCYETALRIFVEGDDQENIARILQQRGICYVEMEEYGEAQVDLLKSLKFYESSWNIRDYPRCLERLGRLHFARGDYGRARSCFENAYQKAEGSDIDTAVYCVVWLARLALKENAPTEKISLYVDHLRSLVAEHGYQNPQHHGQVSIILGHALFHDGNYGDASKSYADGMAEIAAQRRGEYLVKENLNDIDARMSTLSPDSIIQWSRDFRQKWQDPHIETIHPELVRFCDIKERLARTRLAGRSGQ